jgi:hypothetical protein
MSGAEIVVNHNFIAVFAEDTSGVTADVSRASHNQYCRFGVHRVSLRSVKRKTSIKAGSDNLRLQCSRCLRVPDHALCAAWPGDWPTAGGQPNALAAISTRIRPMASDAVAAGEGTL